MDHLEITLKSPRASIDLRSYVEVGNNACDVTRSPHTVTISVSEGRPVVVSSSVDHFISTVLCSSS